VTDAGKVIAGVGPAVVRRPAGADRTSAAARHLAVALANDASLLRRLGGPLLRFAPVLSVGRVVVVSRHADVLDVLRRDKDFTIAEVNAATMVRINGPFVLGMDASRTYTRERAILQGCVRPEDPERIRAEVRAHASALLAEAVPRGRFDVVNDLARPAATRLVGSYFGVPGPDEVTMMRWMRVLFWEAFMNSGGDPEVRRAGEAAGDDLHVYVDELVSVRRGQVQAGADAPDDLLTRLVRAQSDPATRLSDEGVRRNIGGVIVGAVDTTSKATAHAVDELLRRPAELEEARVAARAGDIGAVAAYTFEALRFNPLNPVLARHAARDTVVGRGTSHESTVHAGRTVYAAVLPAMFDPEVFPDPQAFRHDRVPSADLHFGHGMHACFGRYVNGVQIPELVAALLRCEGLRRAPGEDGRLRYEGPFPDRLLVDVGGARHPGDGTA
jgi:cytochrome P450